MSGIPFYMRRQVKQFLRFDALRMKRRHFKNTLRQCSGLIEHYGIRPGESIHIPGSLDQNTNFGRGADSSEKRKRHGNYQRARAGYDQEGQRTEQPCGKIPDEIARNKRRKKSHRHRCKHDNRRVNPGEF